MDINERLDKIENTLKSIESRLTALEVAKPVEVKPVAKPVVEVAKPVEVKPVTKPVEVKPRPNMPSDATFNELRNLLNSPKWPHAVDPALICDISSDQDKEDRAEGILDLIIDVSLENLKFLDFGCGEGHVVNRSLLQKPKMSVGYDIKKYEKWEKWSSEPNMMFTDQWEEVKRHGPYNIILMYDVYDHMTCSDGDTLAQLRELKSSLATNGKIFVRCHPFCSRHGTHLYHQLNKAFAHLVFTDEELSAMGYDQEKVKKVITPIHHYHTMFTAAGLRIHNGPNIIKESVDQFFVNNPLIANRIKLNYKDSTNAELRGGKFPMLQLEQQFVDYILV